MRERYGASTLPGASVRMSAMRRLALVLTLATGCTQIPAGAWTPSAPTASTRRGGPEIYTECAAFLGVRTCRLAEVSDGSANDSELAKTTQALRAAHRPNPGPQSPAPSSGSTSSGALFWGRVAQSALSTLLRPYSSSR